MSFESGLISCAVCGNDSPSDRGLILYPKPHRVAGIPIDLPDVEFHLVTCDSCGFQFTLPRVSADRLLACYAAAEAGHWGREVDPLSRNFDVIANTLRK